jgi:peptidyl-prolyl cis-trans isomerase C
MRLLVAVILGSIALISCATSHDVSEAEMREEYQKVISSYEGKDFHLRHILLMTEGDAKEVLIRLNNGESFSSIAKATSRDTVSARNGGDLGWTAPQVFGPEIEAAVRQAPSKALIPFPIRSRFGWHVVEVDDVRPAKFPPFEDVKDEIESRMKKRKSQRPT